ncbi:MAG: hypothetical protein M1828_006391 [Chrysothrix sp. TS-e1954]|nr:MAG: hypothetical protein M1828_006391 [Chrysothrix sp. TS-e1954]
MPPKPPHLTLPVPRTTQHHHHHHRRSYTTPTASTPTSKKNHLPTPPHTYPKNFLASSTHVGIKPSNTHYPDLALLTSTSPCSAAAVFTQNRFQAAPVSVSRRILQARGGKGIRGVIVNSGGANAVTGRRGVEDARKMVSGVDRLMGSKGSGGGVGITGGTKQSSSPSSSSESIKEEEGEKEAEPGNTLVMSTGVIGQPLPIKKITSAIPTAISNLDHSHSAFIAAARAICTTDTFPKLRSRQFSLPSYPGTIFSLAGMAKGAGMIHPNMATLLGILWTDAPVGPAALQTSLKTAADASFNSISIDGDTSTNDTLAVLANGGAVAPLAPQITSRESQDYAAFEAELTGLATDLAKLVVRDGEGATKFVTITVRGAEEREVGRRIASSIARSPLVKTALYGKDANWGRILCAIGYTQGIPEHVVKPEETSVSFVRGEGEELSLLVDGEPQVIDETRAAKWLEDEDLEILVKLRREPKGEEVKFWTCDFSHEYVTINGDYRT